MPTVLALIGLARSIYDLGYTVVESVRRIEDEDNELGDFVDAMEQTLAFVRSVERLLTNPSSPIARAGREM